MNSNSRAHLRCLLLGFIGEAILFFWPVQFYVPEGAALGF